MNATLCCFHLTNARPLKERCAHLGIITGKFEVYRTLFEMQVMYKVVMVRIAFRMARSILSSNALLFPGWRTHIWGSRARLKLSG